MGIISRIFGDNENTGKVLDGVGKGLDKIVFTKEERAETNLKVSEWYLRYLEATQPQNLARRLVALAVVALWAFLILLGVVIYCIEVMLFTEAEPVIAMFVFKVLDSLVHPPLMMIMGFYFLTHVVRTYTNGAKKND